MKKTKVHFYRETPHVQNLAWAKTPASLATLPAGTRTSDGLTSGTMTFGVLTALLAARFFGRGLTAGDRPKKCRRDTCPEA